MNLETFLTQQSNQLVKQKKETGDLLPKQQPTRSYSTQTKTKSALNIKPTLTKYFYGLDRRKEWIFSYYVQWPFGVDFKDLKTKISSGMMKDFAEEWIKERSSHQDMKYIEIITHTVDKVEYRFVVEDWIKDNFRSASPRFQFPLSLSFYWRRGIPHVFRTESTPNEFGNFIASRFEEWIQKNERKLRHEQFKFLEKIVYSLFDYRTYFENQEIRASLKYSVILAALAGYMLHKHGKEIDKKDVKDIERKVRHFSDIKRLDRYLKRY